MVKCPLCEVEIDGSADVDQLTPMDNLLVHLEDAHELRSSVTRDGHTCPVCGEAFALYFQSNECNSVANHLLSVDLAEHLMLGVLGRM